VVTELIYSDIFRPALYVKLKKDNQAELLKLPEFNFIKKQGR